MLNYAGHNWATRVSAVTQTRLLLGYGYRPHDRRAPITMRQLKRRSLDRFSSRTLLFDSLGAVAQLGERMTGSHEVRGSIPLGSTNTSNSKGPPIGGPL